MRRLWPWFLILLALVPAALVHPAQPRPPAHVTPVQIIGVVGGGGTLNPAAATAAADRLIADNLFPTLFRVSSSGLLEAGLATNVSESGTLVTVTLGRDTLPNGTVLTPTMVADSLSETLWPSTGSTAAQSLLGDVKGARAVEQGKAQWVSGIAQTGPHTLQFTLQAPAPNWSWRLANPALGILPVADRIDGGTYWSTSDLVGPGGYRVVSAVPSASMQFQAVNASGTAPLIEVERYGSVKEAALALVNGEAAAVEVPVSALPIVSRQPFKSHLHYLPAAPEIELLVNPAKASPWGAATAAGPSIARLVNKAFLGYVSPAAGNIPGLAAGKASSSATSPSTPAGSSPGPQAPLPLVVNAGDPMTTALAASLEQAAPGRYQVTALSGASWEAALTKGTASAVLLETWPGNPLPAAVSQWTAIRIMPYGSFWLLSSQARHATVGPDGTLVWNVFAAGAK